MKRKLRSVLLVLPIMLLAMQMKAQTITTVESRCVNNGEVRISGTVGAGGPFQVSITSAPPEYVNPGVHAVAAFPDTIEALYPGIYSLRVVDGAGAVFNSSFTITSNYVLPGSDDYSPTATGVTNCAAPNGSIQGTLTNGRAPYTYTIISGPAQVGTSNSTGTFSGLPAGSYNVQAADSCQNFQTRNVTIASSASGFTLAAPIINKVSCNSWSLDSLTVTPAGTYTYEVIDYLRGPTGGTAVVGTGTSLPITFSLANPNDVKDGFVQIRVTDACGNAKAIQPTTVVNDWSFTDADVIINCTDGIVLNGITANGTVPAPYVVTITPYNSNNGPGFPLTPPQTVTSFPYTVTGVDARNPLLGVTVSVTDACGNAQSISENLRFYITPEVHAKGCDSTTITVTPNGVFNPPLTYAAYLPDWTTIQGTSTTGTFTLPNGSYGISATDACGRNTSTGVLPYSATWEGFVQTSYACDTNVVDHTVFFPGNTYGAVRIDQYDGPAPITATSTLLRSLVDTSHLNNNPSNFGAVSSQNFFGTLSNHTYTYILTDSCGGSDTLSIINPVPSTDIVTHSSYVVNKCINRGDIYGSYRSYSGGWNQVIVVVWNINAPGTELHHASYGNISPDRLLVADAPVGRYVVRYSLEYCANTVRYDTVEVKPYVQPSITTVQSFTPCAGGGSPVSVFGVGGVAPYSYEVLNSNPDHYTAPPQGGNMFQLPSTQTSLTVRIVDACFNSTTRTVAIVKASNPVIRTVPAALATCTLPFNIKLFVDSLYSGSVFQWTKITGTGAGNTVVGTSPSLPVIYNSIVDTGTYQVNITVPNTCYNVTVRFDVANVAITCLPSVTGNVFNDVNGLTDSSVNGNPVDTASGTQLYASLVQNGAVVATTALLPNGTYSFTGVTDGNYTVVIHTTSTGNAATQLPAGWANTGEDCCDGIGSDGLTDGSVGITVAGSDVTNINFGIQQPPIAISAALPIQTNPGDTISVAIAPVWIQGTDANGGVVTSINIISFPVNATTITINGVTYTSATFPATGVTIPADASGNPLQTIAVDPIDGTINVQINYTVTDNAGAVSASATVTVPFIAIPVANADTATTNEDTPVTIPVLTNDTFGGDGPSTGTINVTAQPANGTATVNDGGTPNDPSDDQIIYIPNPGFNRTDTLIYQICDAGPLPTGGGGQPGGGGGDPGGRPIAQITFIGECDTALVIITVTAVNNPPVVADTTITIPEDSTVTVCLPFTDADLTDSHTATIVCGPSNGTVVSGPTVTGNTVCVTYTPNPNYNGLDSICIAVCDNNGLCDTGVVHIIITQVNDLPVANPDVATTTEDAPVSIPVLTNDDFGGDGPSTGTIIITAQPNNGTATVNDGGTPNDPIDDQIMYTPNPNYNGSDTLIYQICDSNGDCDTALVVITIPSVNDGPVANPDVATTQEDTPVTIPVLPNDTFGGDGPSAGTITLVTQPTNGTATLNDGGTPTDPTDDQITYTPNPNFNGSDTLIYQICDNNGDCDTALVVITIPSVSDVPVANPDVATTPQNIPVTVPVLPNDAFGGDGPSTGTITVATQPTNGTATVNDNGTPTDPTDDAVTYTPNTNYTGNDTLIYQICDSNGDCDTAQVVITIVPVNDVPVANADTATTIRNTPVTIPVIPGDSFGNDGPSTGTITVTTGPTNGTVVINDNGTPNDPTDDQIVYTPDTNYTGTDTLIYQICDSNGDCDTALVVINVLGTVPVTLTSFDAHAQANAVALQWKVAQELAVNHYEVEFSTDGKNFTSIGVVAAAGMSLYELQHLYPVNGNNYYRLKMIDNDGRFTYSRVVMVRFAKSGFNQVSIAPNPFGNTVKLNFTLAKPSACTVKMYEGAGQLVYNNKYSSLAGSNTILITNLNGLAKGIYTIVIITDEFTEVQKLLKR